MKDSCEEETPDPCLSPKWPLSAQLSSKPPGDSEGAVR